ncbi:MAG TPA: hypothetical protein VNL37_04040 [Candidatus Polarisedimenticolia bacterium]|nr:hypothetical protein [Candidatus Polarisedimenticolia bacterium]
MTSAADTLRMSAGGWIFLACAWAGIAAVTGYCVYRLLSTRDRRP